MRSDSVARADGVARGLSLGLLTLLAFSFPGAAQDREPITIEIVGPHFPKMIELTVGDSVAWHNLDLVPHTVTVDDDGEAVGWTSDSIEADGMFGRVFTEARRITYRCVYHPGMIGTLVVGETARGNLK